MRGSKVGAGYKGKFTPEGSGPGRPMAEEAKRGGRTESTCCEAGEFALKAAAGGNPPGETC